MESCGEMIRKKGKVQEKMLSLMVFYKNKQIIDKKFNSVSLSVIVRISQVSNVVNEKHVAVGNHP